MPRRFTRLFGIALGIGALAVSPLLALADHVVVEYPDEYVNRPGAYYVVPHEDEARAGRPADRGPSRPNGTEKPAQLAGGPDGEFLTRLEILFLEENIWELDGFANSAGTPGYWYPSPDVAEQRLPGQLLF